AHAFGCPAADGLGDESADRDAAQVERLDLQGVQDAEDIARERPDRYRRRRDLAQAVASEVGAHDPEVALELGYLFRPDLGTCAEGVKQHERRPPDLAREVAMEDVVVDRYEHGATVVAGLAGRRTDRRKVGGGC